MKIAIAGYGLEGKSNYEYFKSLGDITIVDERDELDDAPEGAPTILGEGAFTRLDDFDMVVRTAGLAPYKIMTDGKIWSATNEFFAKCPARIIGVTGSKGKGTTASLISSILRESGRTVHLVGNIGVPALDVLPEILPEDFVVYELSSFQLWDLVRSPWTAVVLMIEPDHLDVHSSFEEYVAAKGNIAFNQTPNDRVIYNVDNEYSTSIANDSAAIEKIGYQSDSSAHVKDDYFWYGEQKLCPVAALRIPGLHNRDNACAAIDAVWPLVSGGDVIAKGLAAFDGLPHRLKYVREVNGVRYYDDSIATTPGSAIAAIEAFEQPKILILGGSSKGADFTELARKTANDNVKHVLTIGTEAEKLVQVLSDAEVPVTNLGLSVTMDDIVRKASELAASGDVVVLSPACASFDMFKSYSDRGEKFIAAVNQL